MVPFTYLIAFCRVRLPAAGVPWAALLLITQIIALCGCASVVAPQGRVNQVPPLQLQDKTLAVDQVAELAPTPDLLAIDDDMREFVERYTEGTVSKRQRLMLLHRAIIGSGTLNLQYEPFAEGTAQEVFHRGSANCLSYANLFVALAREAGLDASYQSLDVRPQWTRQGERLMVRLHVNVMVEVRRGEKFMVDIDPLPTSDITGSREISDRDAEALYHNNIAMDALAAEDLEQAWVNAVRALQFSPREAHFWVNLGAIYRLAGQHNAAESSYLYALQLDPWERSAMNNLVVLYGMEGREPEQQRWMARVQRYRDSNPYFHAWLGDIAADGGDWDKALRHYEEALVLLPEDSNLLYAVGLIYYQLDEYKQATGYIERAIDTATLRSDIYMYEMQLEAVQHRQLAGS